MCQCVSQVSPYLTHLDFTGDGTVDEGGFILLELGDLLLLDGDGCVDFGGLGFDEFNNFLLNKKRLNYCDELFEFVPIKPFTKIGDPFRESTHLLDK